MRILISQINLAENDCFYLKNFDSVFDEEIVSEVLFAKVTELINYQLPASFFTFS